MNSFDDISNIKSFQTLNNESVSLNMNDDNGTYQLSVSLRESCFRSDISITSAFITTIDVLNILTGKELEDPRIKTEYCLNILNSNKELHITIKITFQAKKTLKPMIEIIPIVLHQVDRTMIKSDIQTLKKKMEMLVMQNESLKKKIKYAIGYYDPSIKSISPNFYFKVRQVTNHVSTDVTITLLDTNKEFTTWIKNQERFKKILEAYSANMNLSETTTIWKYSIKLDRNTTTLSEDEQAQTTDMLHQWILKWDSTKNNHFSLNCGFNHYDIVKYLEKRELIKEKKQIDNILITLFELNIEYELKDKTLLPPSPSEPIFKSVPLAGATNKFDILSFLENTTLNGYFFNPAIGFYQTQ
jgi:hypothetical protein